MKPWELLGQTRAPDGAELALTLRSGEYVILANGKSLMSSRMHGSEEALATFAWARIRGRGREEPRVLIGGLGMGFTLRATLDLLPPDATVLVSCGADGVARIWDVAGGRLILALRGHSGAVLSAVFSPDGKLVATTGQDATARIWDAATGAPLAVVSRVGGYPAVFAASGSLVAAAGSIVLARTGDLIADVGEVGETLVSAVSPDGRFAATVGFSGVGGIFRCELCRPLPQLVALARRQVTRTLTPQERARFVEG